MNTERHPFTPFLPDGCRLLMLGSFPPGEQRWSMRFYYPNFTNDMWRIFGLCFYSDKLHFVDTEHKTFRLDLIVPFLNEHRHHGAESHRRALLLLRHKDAAEGGRERAVRLRRPHATPLAHAQQLARLPHETRAQSRVLQQNVQRNISISIRL